MARVQPVSLVSPLQIVLMVCTLAVLFFVPIMDAPLKDSAKLRQEHCGLAMGMTFAGGNSNGAESEACGFRATASFYPTPWRWAWNGSGASALPGNSPAFEPRVASETFPIA